MLDPFYLLSPERQQAVAERAKAKLDRAHAMTSEERKAAAEANMRRFDALPLEWRLLVHEHGPTKVFRALKEGMTAKQLANAQLLRQCDFNL